MIGIAGYEPQLRRKIEKKKEQDSEQLTFMALDSHPGLVFLQFPLPSPFVSSLHRNNACESGNQSDWGYLLLQPKYTHHIS
jgi:hypothetical protein